MKCPSCGKALPEKMNIQMHYCPICGACLFEEGKMYLIEIQFSVVHSADFGGMLVFLDEKELYEVPVNKSICFSVEAGIHTLKFRYGIRDKVINLEVTSGYVIGMYYNQISGLLETNILKANGSSEGLSAEELESMKLTDPILVSGDKKAYFEAALGEDRPEYDTKAASGLKEGRLRLYSDRVEFEAEKEIKKDSYNYNDIVAVKKKMGSIDVECVGNVHKVYSIPKDSYNEVLVYLTNKAAEAHKHVFK